MKFSYPTAKTESEWFSDWRIDSHNGTPQSYGYHDGLDINKKTGGNTDEGLPVYAIADYKLAYYHLKSHLTAGFGVHVVYEVETSAGKRWIHCAHLQENPEISKNKIGKAGDIIGHIGATGRPRGQMYSHLHFAVFKKDPVNHPKGIDAIAKTKEELEEWWENPFRTFENIISLKEEQPLPQPTMPDTIQPILDKYHVQTIQELDSNIEKHVGLFWGDPKSSSSGYLGAARKQNIELEKQNALYEKTIEELQEKNDDLEEEQKSLADELSQTDGEKNGLALQVTELKKQLAENPKKEQKAPVIEASKQSLYMAISGIIGGIIAFVYANVPVLQIFGIEQSAAVFAVSSVLVRGIDSLLHYLGKKYEVEWLIGGLFRI